MDIGDVHAAIETLRDALTGLRDTDLAPPERLAVLDELQALACELPSHEHQQLAALVTDASATEFGAKSWRDVLTARWRIAPAEATRRLDEAAELGPRRSLTGEALGPVLPYLAAARAQGLVTGEQVSVIRKAMGQCPGWVDPAGRARLESHLVRYALRSGPKPLANEADKQLFLLDQDGPAPDDTERHRRRGVSRKPQRRDAMTDLTACLTPAAAATWEAVFAILAAPGMCNPTDPEPCVSGTPSQAQIDGDTRTLAQRQHDALEQVGRWMLEGRLLGRRHGMPATIAIRVELQDLERRAGVAYTGGGTRIPVKDLLSMLPDSELFLGVFDGATGSAMDMFRARRTATTAQRLMLFLRDGGCTKPHCTVPFYGSQAHHAVTDWVAGGRTNTDEMALACGGDNRLVTAGGWATRMNDQHQCEWIPPPHLDTGQPRINDHWSTTPPRDTESVVLEPDGASGPDEPDPWWTPPPVAPPTNRPPPPENPWDEPEPNTA